MKIRMKDRIKRFSCTVCDYATDLKSTLEIYMLIHDYTSDANMIAICANTPHNELTKYMCKECLNADLNFPFF